MNLPSAPDKYDRNNEQTFRNGVGAAQQQAVRGDQAVTRLLFIDQDTGETMTLSIEAGAVVVAPL